MYVVCHTVNIGVQYYFIPIPVPVPYLPVCTVAVAQLYIHTVRSPTTVMQSMLNDAI